MSKYLVRVVLHKDKPYNHPDYAELHKRMDKVGYSTIIAAIGDDGKAAVWKLPPAEYVKEDSADTKAIQAAVRLIANGVDKNNGVLVTKYTDDGISFGGLERVL